MGNAINRKIVFTLIIILLLALLGWKLHTSHFAWNGFWDACRSVDGRMLILATAIVYSSCILRAARWNIFLKPSLSPTKRVHWWALLGPQFIGFAAIAAFGRIAELVRPYLISRRTGLPFSSQVGVVAVDRIFDLGALALIFAGNLVISPQLNALPFHERFHQVGYTITGLTVFLCVFVAAVRLAGEATSRILGGIVSKFTQKGGLAVAAKILEFRDGLNTIASFGDFLLAALYSLLLWVSVALAYVVVMRAFPAPVHDLTISHIILLMGFGMVGTLVSLPGVGGGAQAMTIGALTELFHIPAELAASAGLILWFINTMMIILPGIIYARVEQVSLSSLTRASEAAVEAG